MAGAAARCRMTWWTPGSWPSSGRCSTRGLAALYLQRARETGAFEDYRRAERLARRSLALRVAHNGKTYALLAATLLAQHRFTEARDVARTLNARGPAHERAPDVHHARVPSHHGPCSDGPHSLSVRAGGDLPAAGLAGEPVGDHRVHRRALGDARPRRERRARPPDPADRIPHPGDHRRDVRREPGGAGPGAPAVALALIDRLIAAMRLRAGSPLRLRVVAVSALVALVAARWAVQRSPW